ncbi:MAG: hypothetical protein QF466_02050 [Desulfobacterales bacterium]|nr:hypothetical protein [Desulfobacterales bacterium]MDP6682607.1 hypothetical protein [Desulfobacterales bacterium]MDP6808283.1 hypothetical protein [Desulfobacterales bacterium]
MTDIAVPDGRQAHMGLLQGCGLGHRELCEKLCRLAAINGRALHQSP